MRAGVGDAAGDRLADPPGGVGGELEPFAPVELLDRVNQAQVPFLDEVEERELGGLVFLGDGDHETQVGLDERLGRDVAVADQSAQLTLAGGGDPLGFVQLDPGVAAGLDGLGQAGLAVLGEQGMLADVVEVEADQVFLRRSGKLGGHSSSSLDVPGTILMVPPSHPGSGNANGAGREAHDTRRTSISDAGTMPWHPVRHCRVGIARCTPRSRCVHARSDGFGEFVAHRHTEMRFRGSTPSSWCRRPGLHERLTPNNHRRGWDGLRCTHRWQPCVEWAVVTLDPVVGVLPGVVERGG